MVWHQSLQTVCMHHSVHQKWRVLDLHGWCLVSVESIEHHVNVQQFTKNILTSTGVCKNRLVVNTSGVCKTTQIIPCQDGQTGKPSCRLSLPGKIETKCKCDGSYINILCAELSNA